jgi:hypothetical protein
MSFMSSDWLQSNTEHGMSVVFGEFLRRQGLIDRLMQVPIEQKTYVHAPQAKLVEFLAGIMSGIEYLRDLNEASHPMVKDRVVIQAWGRPGFAHYSGVSRTLEACDERTVAAVEQAINAFSRPYIDEAVQSLLLRGQPIIYDLDLTGQAVSSTSTTYSDVAFGWMDDGIRLGYQLARVSLSPSQDARIWLAGFHHPGNTVSATCLKELIVAAETQTRVRPRRRTELVEQRIDRQREVVAYRSRVVCQQLGKLERLQQTQRTLIGQTYHAEQMLKTADTAQQVTYLTTRLERWRARLTRVETQLAACPRVLAQHRAHLTQQERTLAELQAWHAQLHADNQTNPDPPPYVEARMDAGFASADNLTWLLEMGYCPNTKAMNQHTTAALYARVSPRTCWVRVDDNAEMTAWGDYMLHGCPYPLTVALERFKVNGEYKYATLIHYRDDTVFPTLPVWFQHYNARQTIEAGNKEMKSTFHVQHLMSRSLAGIRIQVLFTGLAANVVRWCAPWLKSCTANPTASWMSTINSPKNLVRVAANTSAMVQHDDARMVLQFVPNSPFPGVTLFLAGLPAIQLALGFNQPYRIDSG